MTTPIPPEKMAAYRRTARERRKARERRLEQRRQEGLEIAAQGAQILKRDFDVEDVILFGSVLSEKLFHERSDIDMAVRGLAEEDYYRAVARLLSLSSEFDVDLVRMEWASPRLLERIAEGVKL